MNRLVLLGGAAAFAVLVGVHGAWSAASDGAEPATKPDITSMSPIEDYKLDTERVVKNWVLCISQSLAETLVRAREQSVAEAEKAYEQLKAARSCGKFAELRVILQQPVYASAEAAGYDARIFGALINISGGWASGYVVFGAIDAR